MVVEHCGLGALPPKVDKRDYQVRAAAGSFPPQYQLTWLPDVKNQGSIGSCVAHATSEILEYFNKQETGNYIPMSTDFIYGMQGVAYGREQVGMYLRDACKIVQTYGDCRNATINTNTEQPLCTKKLREKLTHDVYAEAAIAQINSYARCKTNDDIKHAIMNYGPILASIKWYDKYTLGKQTKKINFNTNSNYGYHAIMVYGWNEHGWLCQNSWGIYWNDGGRFVLPYDVPFTEAWSFVDAQNSDVYTPVRNSFYDILYKIVNFFMNLFKAKG